MTKETEPAITKIGKYSVVDVIGAGGMGIVYRAYDSALNRTVAIKMLRRSDTTDAQSAQVQKFFNREVVATASLQHRNIVTVYESGDQNGDSYLVMECLDGEPVSRIISEKRQMSLVEKLDILIQVCDGLQYAHDRSVIHRDIKPANVILLKDGTAKLVDFGIARIVGSETAVTQTGQVVGSLSYMSPEQINASPIDSRTDIFSAGVLAYELLAYSLPFKGSDPSSTFVKILREEPEPLRACVPEVPPELETAVNRALAKRPRDRYQTAEEFSLDLLSVQGKLKQGMTAEFLERAESAIKLGEPERAKQLLLEIVRLDRQHERANRLLAEVRRVIQNKERAAQVIQMRSQAQVALAGQQYEEALACIEQAVQLDPEDPRSLSLREEIQKIIALSQTLRELLRSAESAMLAGDLEDARLAVEKAISLKPDHAESRALALMIQKELGERARQAQIQDLVNSAREGISNRQFENAIQSLTKAVELDPTDSNVRELMQWATRGKEQELRRKELLELTEEVDRALRADDFSSAFTVCELALAKFPNEESLVRLRAIADRQKKTAERRQFVQDRSVAARELIAAGDVDGAVNLLEAGLAKIPAEPNFEALLAEAHRINQDRRSLSERVQNEPVSPAATGLSRRATAKERANLQKALDAREPIDLLRALAVELSKVLVKTEADGETRRLCESLIEQVRARAEAKERLVLELGEIRRSLSGSSDHTLRSRASARVLEVQTSFPKDQDVLSLCDAIAEDLDAVNEARERAISELSRIADEVGRVRIEEALRLRASADRFGREYPSEPQVGALVQQIHFEVDRRQKRTEARIREIANLQSAISEAPSLESISQLTQNAVSIGSGETEETAVAEVVESVRKAGDFRRKTISEAIRAIEEFTNRALSARNVHSAEQLLEEAKAKAQVYSNIDEIQRILVRIGAQIRGRRVEHDLVRSELETLVGSVQENATASELESIRHRASDVHDRYPQEQTLVALCKEVENAVDAAKVRVLENEIARAREEDRVRAGQQNIGTEGLSSSIRRLEDLVQTFPENVELRSFLLRAREALARADRAQRDSAVRDRSIDRENVAQIELDEGKKPRKGRYVAFATVALAASALGVAIVYLSHRTAASTFKLTIDTSPAAASVLVNGQRCVQNPCSVALPPNSKYEIAAAEEGYVSTGKSGILSHDEEVVLELQKVQASVEPVPSRASGKLRITGLHPTDRLFVDGIQAPGSGIAAGWPVDVGVHHLKLLDGSQELFADSRPISPKATITLSRSDFKIPAPLASEEQVAWDRAEKTQTVEGFEEFLRKYPNSARKDQVSSELQNLYWMRASSSGTIAAYRDYLTKYPSAQGQHFDAANGELDRLEWQSLQNSSDPAQISSFLSRHSKGPYHELAVDRLDDLAWNSAKAAGKVDALKGYLRDYSGGRHRDEANNEIARLTPAPQPPKPAEVPTANSSPPSSPPPSVQHPQDDSDAIRRALDDYQDAYQSRNVDKMRAVWPGISSSQAENLAALFRNNNQIQAPYSILNETVNGGEAKVVIQQFLALGGKKPLPARMTVTLKRGTTGRPWYISSIQ